MGDQLILLGTGDALGVPRVYCDCSVCTEARQGGINRRRRSSVLARGAAGEMLLDCGPDWRSQVEGVGLRHVETVLITHAHQDHIGGVPELADSVRWTGWPVRLVGPEPALTEVASRYPWAVRRLAPEPLVGQVSLLGWTVRTWRVNHGANGHAFAYRLERPDFAWAYCPDSIDLSEAEAEPLRGLDLLVLGTAYYDEAAPRETRSLYSMVEALELLDQVRPGRAIFTHLSHGVDRRTEYPLPAGVTLAHDGMVVELAR